MPPSPRSATLSRVSDFLAQDVMDGKRVCEGPGRNRSGLEFPRQGTKTSSHSTDVGLAKSDVSENLTFVFAKTLREIQVTPGAPTPKGSCLGWVASATFDPESAMRPTRDQSDARGLSCLRADFSGAPLTKPCATRGARRSRGGRARPPRQRVSRGNDPSAGRARGARGLRRGGRSRWLW
jgi:hypothetical protein